MKTLIVLAVVFTTNLCSAQWQSIDVWHPQYGGTQTAIYALGVHDTFLFIGGSSQGTGFFYRYSPALGLQGMNNGINLNPGPVTLLSSLGRYEFASLGSFLMTYETTDNGSHWVEMGRNDIASNGYYLFGTTQRPFTTNPPYIAISRDNGVSWDSVDNFNGTSWITMFATMDKNILASVNKGFYRSTDTGKNWVSETMPKGLSISAFTTLGSSSFAGGAGVFHSSDFGQTWSRISKPADTVISLITYKTYLFAGTDTGIFISSDSGITWRNVSDNMGAQAGYHPRVTNLAIIDTMLYAAVDAGRNSGADFPYGYVTVRPIAEMTDTAQSMVVQSTVATDSIDIYPNPATGIVTIFSGITPILRVSVLNVLGVDVLDITNQHTSDITLDLSKFPAGTYFVRIQTDGGNVLRKIVRE